MANVPKRFMESIRIDSGPYEGRLAEPCMCGQNLWDDTDLYIIEFNGNRLMLVHARCVKQEDDDA